MSDIRHRVGIAAPPERVRWALSTLEGLAGFWSEDVEGDPAPGGTLRYYFGNPEPRVTVEVLDTADPFLIEWRCVGGPDEWVETTLTFQIEALEGETAVSLTQAGWREPVAFMYHCSTKWAYFMLGLKHWLEGADPVAWPHDEKMSSWG
jgi:uncharacterized protein YndB with AHSA1/START domain